MKLIILLIFFILGGCKEFYDEEFEEFQATRASSAQDIRYSAQLSSTDQAIAGLTGTASVDVRNDIVNVDIDLDGIPENLIQIHYSFINAPCNSLQFSIPSDTTSTRTYKASETISVNALAEDLASSGASNGSGDINLRGKSFIIKSFSNFSGTPNESGTNQLTIACGELVVQDETIPNIDIFAPAEPTSPDGDLGTDSPGF